MKKKLTALILALVMTFAMFAPAEAFEPYCVIQYGGVKKWNLKGA